MSLSFFPAVLETWIKGKCRGMKVSAMLLGHEGRWALWLEHPVLHCTCSRTLRTGLHSPPLWVIMFSLWCVGSLCVTHRGDKKAQENGLLSSEVLEAEPRGKALDGFNGRVELGWGEQSRCLAGFSGKDKAGQGELCRRGYSPLFWKALCYRCCFCVWYSEWLGKGARRWLWPRELWGGCDSTQATQRRNGSALVPSLPESLPTLRIDWL